MWDGQDEALSHKDTLQSFLLWEKKKIGGVHPVSLNDFLGHWLEPAVALLCSQPQGAAPRSIVTTTWPLPFSG